MRRFAPWLGLLLLAGVLPARAADPLKVKVAADFDSNYVFRGARHGDVGFVGKVGLSYDLGHGLNLQGNTWNYVQLGTRSGFGEGHYNLNLTYRPPLIGWLAALEGGWTYYQLDRLLNNEISFNLDNTLGRDTQEAYLRLRFDLPGTPTIDLLHDFDKRVGTYLRFQADKSFALKGPWTVDLGGDIGFDFRHGFKDWRNAHARGALMYQVFDGLSVGPTLDLWFPNHRVDPNAGGIRPVVSFGFGYNGVHF